MACYVCGQSTLETYVYTNGAQARHAWHGLPSARPYLHWMDKPVLKTAFEWAKEEYISIIDADGFSPRLPKAPKVTDLITKEVYHKYIMLCTTKTSYNSSFKERGYDMQMERGTINPLTRPR